ncbi:MAG: fused MFS/spermidine synthase [Alphaproteobacteria bacterium]|jgi:hypothetical protein|nr:fused MFS/spermidine synthase [Alphaproteobacteria bacterium]MBT7943817.1 fused MFS/spermidine synthase [Alphaproteobacteria bacterium]
MLHLFTATIFLNALLLFWVQPLFVRMVLPMLGGAPAVWNTAIVFFQTGLLAGYAYAHFINARLPARAQWPVHMLVMLLPLAVLPVAVVGAGTPPVDANPIGWMIVLMTVSVGLPFFAVATNGALLQRWFACSGHAEAKNPYFLYSASNLGSMIALIGYPFAFEPLMGLTRQSTLWAGVYVGLVVLIGVCGWRVRGGLVPVAVAAPAETAALTSRKTKAQWVLLAFVPSSLLLGVTTHISTEVAVAPLLWVVPLALYLLTFVTVFARRPWISQPRAVGVQAVLAILLALTFNLRIGSIGLVFALHLAAFFFTALVCHFELVKRKPPVRDLTSFYLWLAVGGALGGVFNALAAPLLFDSVAEYPIAIILACALRPILSESGRLAAVKDVAFPAVLAAMLLAPFIFSDFRITEVAGWVLVLVMTYAAAAVFAMRARPVRFALAIAALLTVGGVASGGGTDTREIHRTFFGIHKVVRDSANDMFQLYNGMTLHGTQFLDPARRREPTDYYYPGGPLGQFFDGLRRGAGKKRVAVIGLGAGATACYRRPGEDWVFFEIDGQVEALARDTRFFHFMDLCAGKTPVVLGDGRLRMGEAGVGPFDVIILDAFGSDAVPAHLLTTEAMALYRTRLAPGGHILFHLSNRHMRLEPVAAGMLQSVGMTGLAQTHIPAPPRPGTRASLWVVGAENATGLAPFTADNRWRQLTAAGSRPWSDDYWNFLEAIKWK